VIPARNFWCVVPLFGFALPSGAQTTTRLSPGLTGVGGNGDSRTVSISADGRYVAFGSNATNLVPGDGNGVDDIFVADRATGTLVRASLDSSGVEGDKGSFNPAISADGRFVAFHSLATNLVANDTNGTTDIFVRDLVNGTTERVSVDSAGNEAHGDCLYPTISSDGRYVAFQSQAPDLVAGDVNGLQDVFVHDRVTGTTILASVDDAGNQGDGNSQAAWISFDGHFVAFDSQATNLVAGDTNGVNDVFVKDLQIGTVERVSVATGGAEGDQDSFSGPMSADGRYVSFYSAATTLVPFDTNQAMDVFLHDRTAGTTIRVSVTPMGRGGNGDSFLASISADGRFVAFQSVASTLIANDTNNVSDIFVRDVVASTTTRVSIGVSGAQGNSFSSGPSISADGRDVAFYSDASNLVPNDTNGFLDAFVFDRECSGPDPSTPFCAGDGSTVHCPCQDDGSAGRGCANSQNAAGGGLRAAGSTAMNPGTSTDSIVFAVDGLPGKSIALFLQGRISVGPVPYGDGLRCTGAFTRLLGVSTSHDGAAIYPEPGDVSVSQAASMRGDPIADTGMTRFYQVAYRDTDPTFCPPPGGGTINITNGLSLVW
jgi:Tol biopolymer transport system component